MLSGHVTKEMLFRGGVETVAETDPGLLAVAHTAAIEGAAKAVLALRGSAPGARQVVLSGQADES